jgi:hypothetical protein
MKQAFLLLLLLIAIRSEAQTFNRRFSSTSEKLRAISIDRIGDGSYIIQANSEDPWPASSFGYYFLQKIDSNGQILWSTEFALGEYLGGGNYSTFHSDDSTFYVISSGGFYHFDNSGNVIFRKGYLDSTFFSFGSALITSNGFVILGKRTPNYITLCKIGPSGQVLWSGEYQLGFRPQPVKVDQLKNGNYLLMGNFQDSLHGIYKNFIMEVDSTGHVFFQNEYHANNSFGSYLFVVDTIDYCVYFDAGDDSIFNLSKLTKVDLYTGGVIWTKQLNYSPNKLILRNDTLFLFGILQNQFILSLDTSCNPINLVSWDNTSNPKDFKLEGMMATTLSSNIYSISYCRFDVISGPVCTMPNVPVTVTPSTSMSSPMNISFISRNYIDTNFVTTLYAVNFIANDFCTIPVTVNELSENKVIIYPNPARDYITISTSGKSADALLIVYDLYGKQILAKKIMIGNSDNFLLNISLSPGNYLFYLQNYSGVDYKKIITIE